MTEASPAAWTVEQVWVQVHRALQFLTDRLPDAAVAGARRALAGDDPSVAAADAAEVVAFALRQGRIPTTDLEVTVLEECLLALGHDASALADVPAEGEPLPESVRFAAGPAGVVASDARVLPLLAGRPGVLAVWRTWRRPVAAASWPPPAPVYLVETADVATLRDVVRAVHGPGTVDPGPGGPIVEPYVCGHQLPDLHRRAQQAGLLVHVGVRPPEFLLADLFDGLPGPDGRPLDLVPVTPDEAAALLERLAAGRPVQAVEHAAVDVLVPAAGPVVPLHLLTDGRWVWSQAAAHYLHRHLVAPPRAFHAYLRGTPPEPPPSDAVVALAAQWLRHGASHPPGEDPARSRHR